MLTLTTNLNWHENNVRWILICLSICTFIGAFSFVSEHIGFERFLFESGQYWRPFSAWFAQLNLRHWLLNQWGLVVLALLLPKSISRATWVAFALIWLSSSVLLAVSSYDNYVGLSGVLYGWLIFAAARSPYYSKAIKLVFMGCLSIKVLSENGYVPLPDSTWVAEFIQGDVAHESHLWGLISGFFMSILWWIFQRFLKIP